MNSIHFHDHPKFEELLGILDSDAPGITRGVRQHVKVCWKCRSHIEEMQTAISEFARYQERCVLPSVPPAPRPWLDLRLAMRQWDGRNPEVHTWKKLGWARIGLPGAFACAALAYMTIARVAPRPEPVPPTSVSKVASSPEPTHVEPRLPSHAPVEPRKVAAPVKIEPIANVEARVIAALHRIGADLGDPLEISAGSGGGVKVQGVGLPEERQAEIRRALAAEPNVAIQFEKGPARSADDSTRASFDGGRNLLESELTRIAGGPAAFERLANRVLDESDAMLARAHALHDLAMRFPEVRREELGVAERSTLDEIAAEHVTKYNDHAAALIALLGPVRQGLGAAVPGTGSSTDRLEAAQRLDRVISVIFGVAPTTASRNEVLAELSTAMGQLANAAGARK